MSKKILKITNIYIFLFIWETQTFQFYILGYAEIRPTATLLDHRSWKISMSWIYQVPRSYWWILPHCVSTRRSKFRFRRRSSASLMVERIIWWQHTWSSYRIAPFCKAAVNVWEMAANKSVKFSGYHAFYKSATVSFFLYFSCKLNFIWWIFDA